jgi:hypothetical protein
MGCSQDKGYSKSEVNFWKLYLSKLDTQPQIRMNCSNIIPVLAIEL